MRVNAITVSIDLKEFSFQASDKAKIVDALSNRWTCIGGVSFWGVLAHTDTRLTVRNAIGTIIFGADIETIPETIPEGIQTFSLLLDAREAFVSFFKGNNVILTSPAGNVLLLWSEDMSTFEVFGTPTKANKAQAETLAA